MQPDEFDRHILGDPELSREASMVVLDGETPVSLAFLLINPESMIGMSDMTGTLPEYRGRGLAQLAKLAVIRAALASSGSRRSRPRTTRRTRRCSR